MSFQHHRMAPTPKRHRAWLMAGYAFALMAVCTGAGAQDCVPADPAAAMADVTLTPQWDKPGQTFEGWGTALAWFAHVTGQLSPPIRTHLADLLYGEDGLQLNIARYNIGGGNAPDTAGYLRAGADVPGFWRLTGDATKWNPDDAGSWDWTADAGQRWWLDAIRDRVPETDRIFEAFSNSPPWFMTVSGRVSGNEDGLQDNLRPGEEGRFAGYLVRVTEELERRHQIVFRTLSPVNEPGTPYWFAANTQEGGHWSPARQAQIIKAVHAELQARGVKTQIAGVDETNAQTFMLDWAGLDDAARASIEQINVHSYDTTGKAAVRDLARATGKRLWMSEVDLSPPNVRQDYDDMRPAIALGEQIVSDINRMQPVAWVLWQAVENESQDPASSSNWGLIKMDFANRVSPDIHVTAKYWAMGQFSKYIRPGDHFIPVDDDDTVVAVRPGAQGFVAVHVNPGLLSRRLKIDLPPEGVKRPYTMSLVVSDSAHHLDRSCPATQNDDGTVVVPPMSVTTITFDH